MPMGKSRRKNRRRRPPQEQPKMNKRLFDKAKDRVKKGPKIRVVP